MIAAKPMLSGAISRTVPNQITDDIEPRPVGPGNDRRLTVLAARRRWDP